MSSSIEEIILNPSSALISIYNDAYEIVSKKGKSKKAVSAVGGELERRRDWTERVGEEKNKNRESDGVLSFN